MLLASSLKITWNPGGYVLLDFGSVGGDLIADEIEPGMEQQTSIYQSLGLLFAGASADGGSRIPISYTRELAHADAGVAMNYCWVHPRLLPFGKEGTLTVEIQNGATFDLSDAVIHAANPRPCFPHNSSTQTMYRLSAGQMLPTAGLPVIPGYPLSWYLTACQDVDISFGNL